MHNLFKVFLLVVLFVSFGFSEADGPDYWKIQGVERNDVLWIHPTADYQSEKIGKIPYNGICIKNLGCTSSISFNEYQKLSPRQQRKLKHRSNWCKVTYRGTTGWVNGKYLGEGRSCQ